MHHNTMISEKDDEHLHQDRQHVFAAHQTAVEQRQAGHRPS
jgi:hypothetical protein